MILEALGLPTMLHCIEQVHRSETRSVMSLEELELVGDNRHGSACKGFKEQTDRWQAHQESWLPQTKGEELCPALLKGMYTNVGED